MFRHYRIIFRELAFVTSPTIAAVGYVTWRCNEYEIPEDDTTVSKHV